MGPRMTGDESRGGSQQRDEKPYMLLVCATILHIDSTRPTIPERAIAWLTRAVGANAPVYGPLREESMTNDNLSEAG